MNVDIKDIGINIRGDHEPLRHEPSNHYETTNAKVQALLIKEEGSSLMTKRKRELHYQRIRVEHERELQAYKHANAYQ